jgi:hypothetical protein
MDRIERLKAVNSVDEVSEILGADAVFTIQATDGVGDKIEIVLFNDDTGIVLSYVSGENVALGVPLSGVTVDYHTQSGCQFPASVN